MHHEYFKIVTWLNNILEILGSMKYTIKISFICFFLMWLLEKLKLYLEEACFISLPGNAGPYAQLLLKSKALWQGLQCSNTTVSWKYSVWPGQCSKSLLFRCLYEGFASSTMPQALSSALFFTWSVIHLLYPQDSVSILTCVTLVVTLTLL